MTSKLRCIKVSTYCIFKKLYEIIKNWKYPGRETIFRAWNSFLKQNDMRIIIEIEKNEDIEKLKKAFKGETIIVVTSRSERNKILESIFKKYNVKLPRNYSFDREAIRTKAV
jgi:hypothetical protein